MTVLRAYRILIQAMLVFAVLGAAAPSWAESSYSRDQVEQHLQQMFINTDDFIANTKASMPNGQFMGDLVGFDLFVRNKKIRFSFFDLKQEEKKPVRDILEEFFSDILRMPAVAVNPYESDFDLLVYVSDDLIVDAMTPKYKSTLKGPDESEEAYLEKLQKQKASDVRSLQQKYLRNLREPLVIIAVERPSPELTQKVTFETHLRFMLVHAVTGALYSTAIQPSVMNPPDIMRPINGFTPIDRAVLRTIFGHQDWSGMDYEAKIQLLTDRVMKELAAQP